MDKQPDWLNEYQYKRTRTRLKQLLEKPDSINGYLDEIDLDKIIFASGLSVVIFFILILRFNRW